MPAPPYSSGVVGPKTPSSASSGTSSMGKVPFSKCSMTTGRNRSRSSSGRCHGPSAPLRSTGRRDRDSRGVNALMDVAPRRGRGESRGSSGDSPCRRDGAGTSEQASAAGGQRHTALLGSRGAASPVESRTVGRIHAGLTSHPEKGGRVSPSPVRRTAPLMAATRLGTLPVGMRAPGRRWRTSRPRRVMPVEDLRAGHRSRVRCECEQRTGSFHVPLRDPRGDGSIASGTGRDGALEVLGPTRSRQLSGRGWGTPRGLRGAVRGTGRRGRSRAFRRIAHEAALDSQRAPDKLRLAGPRPRTAGEPSRLPPRPACPPAIQALPAPSTHT